MKKLLFALIILTGGLSAFAEEQTETEASLPPIPNPTPPMILDRQGQELEEARLRFRLVVVQMH